MNWLQRLLDRLDRWVIPPVPGPKPGPTPAPAPPANASQAAELVAAINFHRAEHGLPPVACDPNASSAAAVQACWQAARDRIGHDGPPGYPTHMDRLRLCRVPSGVAAGEICAMGQQAYWPDGRLAISYDFNVACRDWLESPGHRAILLGDWTHAGAAIATATTHPRTYCTAVFYR